MDVDDMKKETKPPFRMKPFGFEGKGQVIYDWATILMLIYEIQGGTEVGSSGKFVGGSLGSGLVEEAIELSTGSIKSKLIVFEPIVNERTSAFVNRVSDEPFGGELA